MAKELQYYITIKYVPGYPDPAKGFYTAEMEQTDGLMGTGDTEELAIASLKVRVAEEIERLKGQEYTRIYRPEPENEEEYDLDLHEEDQ